MHVSRPTSVTVPRNELLVHVVGNRLLLLEGVQEPKSQQTITPSDRFITLRAGVLERARTLYLARQTKPGVTMEGPDESPG